jgi:DNA mismatch repair protein MutL
MKTDAAESSSVIEFASQIALAYPELKIRMINNGTLLFSTNGKGDRYKNILTVFDKSIGEDLIPVRASAGYLEIEGYVSNPGKSRATRRHQIFFVNGRVIESKVIQRGISQAYADKLFEGRHPIVFLFLKVRPDTLDVNIHPNKREIRFDDEKFIVETIRSAIREALLSGESIPQVKKQDIFKLKKEP